MNSGFRGSAGQRLARTGKNLAGSGGRRSGPGGNGNTARRNWRNNRLPRGERRTQRGRTGRQSRSRLNMRLAGRHLRRFRHGFLFGNRRRPGWLDRFGDLLDLAFCLGRCREGGSVRFPCQPALDLNRYRFIDRAGVGFLFRDAQLRKHVEDHVGFHLELACQLVYSNFDHTVCPAVQFRHRGYQIKPCSLSRASAPAGTSAMSIVTDCSCASSVSSLAVSATGSAGAAPASPPDSNCP